MALQTAKDKIVVLADGVSKLIARLRTTRVGRFLIPLWTKANGYHFGVRWCAYASVAVLLLNTIATVWASNTFPTTSQIGTLQSGSCKQASNLGFWIHLMINVLSTALLGASNYTMQCLSSPTRAEIDRAHQRGTWLYVGIPSITNMLHISRRRQLLWWTLLVTTVPLHLMWNSAVFVSLSSYDYTAWVVPSDWPEGFIQTWRARRDQANSTVDPTSTPSPSVIPSEIQSIMDLLPIDEAFNVSETLLTSQSNTTSPPVDFANITSLFQKTPSTFQRLSTADCLTNYAANVVSERADVLLVSGYNSSSPFFVDQLPQFSVHFADYAQPNISGAWLCDFNTPKPCKVQLTQPAKLQSEVFGTFNVQYCWSQRMPEHCSLQFSVVIMTIVIACNLCKAICFCYVAWRHDGEPMITIGDATASFLRDPDPTTRGICLADYKTFEEDETSRRRLQTMAVLRGYTPAEFKSAPVESHVSLQTKLRLSWRPRQVFWFTAANNKRYAWCLVLVLAVLGATGFLLSLALESGGYASISLSFLWSQGFGNVSASTLLGNFAHNGFSTVKAILLSNSPQLVLSIVYLGYNSLFTAMCMAREWNAFAAKKLPLRVTSPQGEQISTYWLQLPYRYSVPLMGASATLHWLVSQSLFLSLVTVLDNRGLVMDTEAISTTGYSAIAILFSLGLGIILLVMILVHGFFRFNSIMPLTGGCSAVISAACHPPRKDNGIALKRVQWGVVTSKAILGIDHCSFSCNDVSKPVTGHIYA